VREISPGHDFLLAQTECVCTHHAIKELFLPLPRSDLPIIGGCNPAYSSPEVC
jgi:hypothetical protein